MFPFYPFVGRVKEVFIVLSKVSQGVVNTLTPLWENCFFVDSPLILARHRYRFTDSRVRNQSLSKPDLRLKLVSSWYIEVVQFLRRDLESQD